jgi:SAM-dependent methyltransferase
MAVLWRLESGGTRYEVRSHGATRRLLSDGVFHSAWNPRTGLTGRVWDQLLAAAFAPERAPSRILVLGIGAGTALLQYRRFLSPEVLVGVDLDPVHVQIGREFFGLDTARAELFEADARAWVKGWRGPKFDLVVEDLYGHREGEPERAVPVTAAWAEALGRLVAPGGALVMNFISPCELRASALFRMPATRSRYPSAFMLRGPSDENAVAALCRERTTPAAIRARVRAVPGLDDRKPGCRLRYGIQTLW